MSKNVRFYGVLVLACSTAWAQSSKLSPDLAGAQSAFVREGDRTVENCAHRCYESECRVRIRVS